MIIAIVVTSLLLFVAYKTFAYRKWYNELRIKGEKAANEKIKLTARKFDHAYLEAKRLQMDLYADGVIEDIMNSGQEPVINKLFGMLMKNKDIIPEEIHPKIKEYFEKTAILPDWADKDLIEFGQENYIRHGLLIGMLLFYKSLPECYSGAKGAEVLKLSARLDENNPLDEKFSKRMAETGLFVSNVMMPGGLSLQGDGIVAAQKVRLMHAVIRFHLKKSGRWDFEKFDEPINQEDLAGTLISFSGLILEGLDTIGAKLDPVEAEAFVHCWSVIGHVMGVDEDLLPKNAQEALNLGHAVIDHQKAKSAAGVSLTKALLNFCRRKAPFFIGKDFHAGMIRFLIGKEYCDILELEELDETYVASLLKNVRRYTSFREFLEHSSYFALPVKWIDKILLFASIRHLSKNKLLHFYLPKSFNMD